MFEIVTPYGGVWIEMHNFSKSFTVSNCHALWRRVD